MRVLHTRTFLVFWLLAMLAGAAFADRDEDVALLLREAQATSSPQETTVDTWLSFEDKGRSISATMVAVGELMGNFMVNGGWSQASLEKRNARSYLLSGWSNTPAQYEKEMMEQFRTGRGKQYVVSELLRAEAHFARVADQWDRAKMLRLAANMLDQSLADGSAHPYITRHTEETWKGLVKDGMDEAVLRGLIEGLWTSRLEVRVGARSVVGSLRLTELVTAMREEAETAPLDYRMGYLYAKAIKTLRDRARA